MRVGFAIVPLMFLLAPPAWCQQTTLIGGFGFGAGVVMRSDQLHPAPELTARLRINTALLPVQLSVGSSVADLRTTGTRHDTYGGAHALFSLTRFFALGAGAELHSISDEVRSSFRPAISGLALLQLPLAPHDAAVLEIGGRGAVMRGLTQTSASLGIRLAPWRGGLTVGERVAAPRVLANEARSWDAVVQQLMLLQEAGSPLRDVVATRNAVLLKFVTADDTALHATIGRVARVLNGSDEPVYLTIQGPDPERLAAAATAAGFPAERIRELSAQRDVTLQAIRQPVAAVLRSARP